MSNTYNQKEELLLFDRIKGGDQGSFKQIYDRYWEPLYVHALVMLEDEFLAQDAIQELFIKLWDRRAETCITTNVKSYLYASARNMVISKIRQQTRRTRFSDEFEQRYKDWDEMTVEKLETRSLEELIDSCIDALPDRMQEVFKLSRKEHLNSKEIADKLGTTEGTVKKQLSNSIKVLRLALAKHLIFLFIIFFTVGYSLVSFLSVLI